MLNHLFQCFGLSKQHKETKVVKLNFNSFFLTVNSSLKHCFFNFIPLLCLLSKECFILNNLSQVLHFI